MDWNAAHQLKSCQHPQNEWKKRERNNKIESEMVKIKMKMTHQSERACHESDAAAACVCLHDASECLLSWKIAHNLFFACCLIFDFIFIELLVILFMKLGKKRKQFAFDERKWVFGEWFVLIVHLVPMWML